MFFHHSQRLSSSSPKAACEVKPQPSVNYAIARRRRRAAPQHLEHLECSSSAFARCVSVSRCACGSNETLGAARPNTEIDRQNPLLHELVPASRRVFRFEEVLAEQACDNWLVFVVNLFVV